MERRDLLRKIEHLLVYGGCNDFAIGEILHLLTTGKGSVKKIEHLAHHGGCNDFSLAEVIATVRELKGGDLDGTQS